MGSLFSTPSIPSISSVQYVAPSTSINPTSLEPQTIDQPQSSETEDVVKDVIRRSQRGRSSTIQTSFRGVLGETNTLVPQRKSLLGE